MSLAEVLAFLRSLPVKERLRVVERIVHEVAENELPRDAPGSREPRRRAGSAAGRVRMAPDFDDPLDDFAAYA